MSTKSPRMQSRVRINWAAVASEAADIFCRGFYVGIYSTAGRRLRIFDGRCVRHLCHAEKIHLWVAVRDSLLRHGARGGVGQTRLGIRAVALLAELPPTSRSGKGGCR